MSLSSYFAQWTQCNSWSDSQTTLIFNCGLGNQAIRMTEDSVFRILSKGYCDTLQYTTNRNLLCTNPGAIVGRSEVLLSPLPSLE